MYNYISNGSIKSQNFIRVLSQIKSVPLGRIVVSASIYAISGVTMIYDVSL
jgi:hypothetical protein